MERSRSWSCSASVAATDRPSPASRARAMTMSRTLLTRTSISAKPASPLGRSGRMGGLIGRCPVDLRRVHRAWTKGRREGRVPSPNADEAGPKARLDEERCGVARCYQLVLGQLAAGEAERDT